MLLFVLPRFRYNFEFCFAFQFELLFLLIVYRHSFSSSQLPFFLLPPNEMSQRRQLILLFSLAPVFLLLSAARPVCPTNSDLDNTLIEQPKISCEESRIKMSIRTERPFAGNVYAKGFFHKDVCRVQGNGSGHVANITIPVNADCGMRRRRSVGPHGLSLEIDVILMFHNKFLIKNDRAFHVECQYVEMDQRVGNRLDISALPSTELSQTLNHPQTMPKCRYEVVSAETGHQISFAAIGQPIMHKWSCQPGSKEEGVSLYCLTVHSCEVDDGQGSLQKLLDDKGCPMDKGLFGPVEYKGDLEAIQRGNAFKFADRPTIYFSCQLRLELKTGWKECKRSSENCGATAGGKGGKAAESNAEKPNSEPTESSTDESGDDTVAFASSPEFPTPSSTFSSSGGFSMSTGTTSSSLSASGYPATRIPMEESEEEEEGHNNEWKEEKPKVKQSKKPQPKPPKGKGGQEEGSDEKMEANEAHSEGVYVERPTLSIIQKTKRTTRTTNLGTTRAKLLAHSTSPPSNANLALKGIYAAASSSAGGGCNTAEFGLNSDCAFDVAPGTFSTSKEQEKEREENEDDEKEIRGRFGGRLSLRQRSTTPLEEMEHRMNRMSSNTKNVAAHSMDIDVSQAVDVLDVVAQSDGGANREGMDKFCGREMPPFRRTQRPQAEPIEPFQQLCISRQLLSSALFLAVLCLLSILTIFICCLFSCQHRLRLNGREGGILRPKPPILTSACRMATNQRRGGGIMGGANSSAVLDAYNP